MPQSHIAQRRSSLRLRSYLRRLSMPTPLLPRGVLPGLTPQQILRARGWDGKPIPVAPIKLGFVSLGGAISTADINGAAAGFNLPQPKVTFLGSPGPADPNGADVENALDFWSAWVWSAATGQPANITVAWQPNDDTGIPNGFRALADAGVECSSISWGAPRSQWSAASISATQAALQYCLSKGCWPHPASGDNSVYDGTNAPTIDLPCGFAEALAIGGILLQLNPDGSIKQQSGWGDGRPGDEGGGGGLDTATPIPSYQKAVLAGNWRGVPDWAENADPASGFATYTGGQFISVGGTSGAAPTACGLMAIARGVAKLAGKPVPNDPHSLLYANLGVFLDVTMGSDGNLAKVGYDLVTGNGTLILPNLITLFSGGTVVNPPVTPPPVSPPPVVPPTGTSIGVMLNRPVRANGVVAFRTPVTLAAGPYTFSAGAPAHQFGESLSFGNLWAEFLAWLASPAGQAAVQSFAGGVIQLFLSWLEGQQPTA